MICTLTYLVLRCADLETSHGFYKALGLAPLHEQHGQGPAHYSCKLGDMVLELYPLAKNRTSGMRFGIRVPNVAKTLDSLKQIHAEIVRAATDGSASAALIRDPDGHEIE